MSPAAHLLLHCASGLSARQIVNRFTLSATLTPSEDGNAKFGAALDYTSNANILVVGAPHHAPNKTGAVYLYLQQKEDGSARLLTILYPNISAELDYFGSSVKISGDGTEVLVGAPGAPSTSGGVNAGAVYAFRRCINSTNYTQVDRIQHPFDPLPNLYFGSLLAVSSDWLTLVVSSCNSHRSSCSSEKDSIVTVYNRSSIPEPWSNARALTPVNPTCKFCRYGSAVAIQGGRIYVSTYSPDNTTGLVHVFSRMPSGEWNETSSIFPPSDIGDNTGFAHMMSVSKSGSQAAVAMSRPDSSRSRIFGDAFVFREVTRKQWNPSTVRLKSLSTPGQGSLASVMQFCSEDMIAVSDMFDSSVKRDGGAVTLFVRGRSGRWDSVKRFFPPDIGTHMAFGSAIVFSTDCRTMCVGSIGMNADHIKPYRAIDSVFVFTTIKQKS